jgi:uncharacterized protein YndB with AHSA1/START domain
MKMNIPVFMTIAAAALLAAYPAASQSTGGAPPSPSPSSPSKKSLSSSSPSPSSRSSDRILRASLVLDAPVEDVWKLWTTEDGVKSFFAPGCRIEPKVDGLYEIWFNPAAPAGEKGGDGLRILVFEPGRRLSFTWNAPPSQPAIRAQRTVVDVRLFPEGEKKTRLVFTHGGWGDGPEWDAAYAYFDKAWNGFVLPNLVWRLAHGPIDWKARPEVKPLAESLRIELSARP